MAKGSCEMCVNYVYDEDYECYCCLVNLDEDEMYRFLSGNQHECAECNYTVVSNSHFL